MKNKFILPIFIFLIASTVWAQEVIMEFTVATGVNIPIRLFSVEESYEIEIDWGEGKTQYTIKSAGTSISHPSSTGEIKVYADPSSIKEMTLASANFRTVDVSKASGLTTISISNSTNNITSLVLPEESANLQILDVSYSKLTELDLSSYLNLKKINCKSCQHPYQPDSSG